MEKTTIEDKTAWIKELKKELNKSKKKWFHGNIKCDCGHTKKDHYNGEGFCHDSTHKNPGKCGCTWFYPNMKYIKKLREKLYGKKRN